MKMRSVEQNAIDAVLNKIRARREISAIIQNRAYLEGPSAVRPPQLRKAQFSDFEAVTDLKRRWGIVVDQLENWERLWRRNPALARIESWPAMGWVLESKGKIVGYLGNIPLLYCYGGRTLTATAGSGLVVEPAYRLFAMRLMAAFFGQPGVDLYVATTAIDAVGKIARAFGSDPLPQPGYGTVLFWILRGAPFARAVARKMGLRKPISYVGNILASLAVGTDGILRRRRPKAVLRHLAVSEIRVDEIGDDFQTIWLEKLSEGARLYADRSANTLRWHFDVPGFRGTTRVLCCCKNRELVGYAVIRNNPRQEDGLRRSIVADILAKRDDPEVLSALFVAAYDHAQRVGSHVLEARSLPPEIQQLCRDWKPYVRKHPACPFYYKANDPVLHRMLASSAAWYASPFDGDATLMP